MTHPSADTLRPCCLFRRGGRDFALPLSVVVDTLPPGPVTSVPLAPPGLLGITLHRNRPIPVVVVDTLLGATESDSPDGTWLVCSDGRIACALAVDHILGVTLIALQDVNRAQSHPLGVGTFARGTHTMTLLDPELLLPAITATLLPPSRTEAPQ